MLREFETKLVNYKDILVRQEQRKESKERHEKFLENWKLKNQPEQEK